ncbi:DUF3857 domain-containing protein [Costertonia aggregata]|uniref:DUF3857 domain-containing protein n=1 Tax=Costertonia aggregata TaxID=343403 RepID=A0A7H9ALY8_9FLAO|nr:DUF3857 domain-containing protein [Costertonia aggregata]QLG44427.1 DUF3857 domain-containing protein [Costertonia aggregata]
MRFTFLFFMLFFSIISTSQNSIYSVSTIGKDMVQGANAVVRLNEMRVELLSMKEMKISSKRVVTVLNKLGNKHAGASLGYNNSTKVRNAIAIIYDARGNEINLIKRKDFTDVSAVDGGTLYSDSRIMYLEHTPIAYPYTIEFEYEIVTKNTSNIPNWYFLDGFLVSTEKSIYSITYNEYDQKPEFKEKNFGTMDFSKNELPNQISYEAFNIKAIKQEALSPPFNKIAPKLMVRAVNFHYEGYNGHVSNWKDLGTWMSTNLLMGRNAVSEATKMKIKSLVNGVEDDLEKAKLIYRYVQNNTRYISVQVGIGGIQPSNAIEVDDLKYGDCKGLSNYTKALLEIAGVTSYYTHVEAGKAKVDFEEDFADLAQGNHVILAIPYNEQYYWIDCTSQIHPFGFLGDFTDGRKVLVIKPDNGEIVTTSSYLNKENHQKTTADYSINENGDISGEIIIKTKGIQYDNRFSLENQSVKDITTHYKNYWDNINNLIVLSHDLKNDKENIIFAEKVSVKANGYASKSGDRILFVANAFDENSFVPNRYRSRQLPLEIQRGYLDEDEFSINIPKGYMIEAIPNNKTIESEFGTYKIKFKYNEKGSNIKYTRSLFIKEGYYEKEKYSAYRSFRKETANNDAAKIVLIKKQE